MACNHEDYPCCGCQEDNLLTWEQMEEMEREEYEAWRDSCDEDIQFENIETEQSEQFDDDYDSFIDREDC